MFFSAISFLNKEIHIVTVMKATNIFYKTKKKFHSSRDIFHIASIQSRYVGIEKEN